MPLLIENALTAVARQSPKREVCGFVLKSWVIHFIKNVSEQDDRFAMDSNQLLEFYEEHYYEVLGIFHSHWNGQDHPSDADEAYVVPQWRYWIVTFDKVSEWELRDGRFQRIAA